MGGQVLVTVTVKSREKDAHWEGGKHIGLDNPSILE